MKLTQKNFATTLPKDLLKLAEKNTVRECDETAPCTFVAYVDQGNESFDVSIRLSPDGEVLEHQCDCPDGDAFCRHKTALLSTLVFGKKTTTVVKKAKKKETPVEAALADVSLPDLRLWVAGVLKKNKDLEMAFMAHFARVDKEFTPKEVVETVRNSLKAVMGVKRSAIDTNQLKRLVDVWAGVLRPMVDQYLENPADEKRFLLFHIIITECSAVQDTFMPTSNKIPRFIEGLLRQAQEVINALPGDEDWYVAAQNFADSVCDDLGHLHPYYSKFLFDLLEATAGTRSNRVIEALVKHYETLKKDKDRSYSDFMRFLFDVSIAGNQFARYKKHFHPVRYDNDYNVRLINALLEDGDTERAITMCNDQVNKNTKDEFSVGYYHILKRIYTDQGNIDGLLNTCSLLVPLTFDIDDYKFVAQNLSPAEQKKWTKKILTEARHAMYSAGDTAETFYFEVLDMEGDYAKIIETLSNIGSVQMMVRYFKKMFDADKDALMTALIRRHYGLDWWRVAPTGGTGSEPADLFTLLTTHYTQVQVLAMYQKIERQRGFQAFNLFLVKLKEWLAAHK
jgi:hypothetical protein